MLVAGCMGLPLPQIIEHKFIFWVTNKYLWIFDCQCSYSCQMLVTSQRDTPIEMITMHLLQLFVCLRWQRCWYLFLLFLLCRFWLGLSRINCHSRCLLLVFLWLAAMWLMLFLVLNPNLLVFNVPTDKEAGKRNSKNCGKNGYNHKSNSLFKYK